MGARRCAASLRDDARVSFLTLNEKRQAVGYAPVEEPVVPPAPENDATVVLRKYRSDQARAPRGRSDGGRWVDEGGGGGARAGVLGSGSIASGVRAPAAVEADDEERVQVAQAGGNYGIDVTEEDRLYGGHTFERHVGKPDEYLIARILGNRINIPFLGEVGEKRAGSFPSIDAANKLVNATLSDPVNQATIEAFVRRDFFYSFPVLNAYKEFKQPTGKEAFGPAGRMPEMRTTYWVRVRLRRSDKAEKGYYVDSAFPLNRD